jgi:hypothetical protein
MRYIILAKWIAVIFLMLVVISCPASIYIARNYEGCQPRSVTSVQVDSISYSIEEQLWCSLAALLFPSYSTSLVIESMNGAQQSYSADEYFRYSTLSALISNSGAVIRFEETLTPGVIVRSFEYNIAEKQFYGYHKVSGISVLNSPDWHILKQVVRKGDKWIEVTPVSQKN